MPFCGLLQPRPVLPLDKVELGFETPGTSLPALMMMTLMYFYDKDDYVMCFLHCLYFATRYDLHFWYLMRLNLIQW